MQFLLNASWDLLISDNEQIWVQLKANRLRSFSLGKFSIRFCESGYPFREQGVADIRICRPGRDRSSQPASETDRQTTMTPETTFIKVRLKWNIVHARFSNNDIAICSHLLDGGGRGDRRGGGVRHGCQIMRNKSELYCIYLSQFSLYLTYITYVALTLLFLSLFLSLFYHTFRTSIFHNVRTYIFQTFIRTYKQHLHYSCCSTIRITYILLHWYHLYLIHIRRLYHFTWHLPSILNTLFNHCECTCTHVFPRNYLVFAFYLLLFLSLSELKIMFPYVNVSLIIWIIQFTS